MIILPPTTPPHIKVCGITRTQDAALALELGASFLGLIFAEGTPRCLTREEARAILDELRGRFENVRAFGVFVHEPASQMQDLVDELALAAVQIHGRLRSTEELKHLSVTTTPALAVGGPDGDAPIATAQTQHDIVLLDTFKRGVHGGTGQVFDHALAAPALERGPVILAGGLGPDTIGPVLARLRAANLPMPYAFDASSGLESAPRLKDPVKMRAFFDAYRAAWATPTLDVGDPSA